MNFVFSLSTGRSGTKYLSELFKVNTQKSTVFHERLKHENIGIQTPDMSTMVQFNTVGFSDMVQAFWKRKWDGLDDLNVQWYVETSHQLMKAGLLESCYEKESQDKSDTYHFLILERDIGDTVESMVRRGDFKALINFWYWYLEPGYQNNLLSFEPYKKHNYIGRILWYIHEVRVRSRVYQLLYETVPNFNFYKLKLQSLNDEQYVTELFKEITIPFSEENAIIPKAQNVGINKVTDYSQNPRLKKIREKIDEVVESSDFDFDEVAQTIVQQRSELGNGFLWAPSYEKM